MDLRTGDGEVRLAREVTLDAMTRKVLTLYEKITE